MHQGQPVLTTGTPLDQAQAALVMIHGRGASASDVLSLTQELDVTGFTCLAPQAAGGQWYPYRFIEPVERNEPYLTSALQTVDAVISAVAKAGISREKLIVLGFSQGACLALEYAARHPQLYGGVVALSGALIMNGDRARDYTGSLDNTPIFLGCSDRDPHVPEGRVDESATILQNLGARVEKRIYPNMGHTVNADELEFVQRMMTTLLEPGSAPKFSPREIIG